MVSQLPISPVIRSGLVPRPVATTFRDGPPHLLGPDTVVLTGPSTEETETGVLLASLVSLALEVAVPVSRLDDGAHEAAALWRSADGDAGPRMLVRLDPGCGPAGSTNPERYEIDVDDVVCEIVAAEPAGFANALGTLRQLARPTDTGQWRIDPVHVVDEPRLPWRGLTLDLARHHVTPADLRVVVSLMSMYHLNRLHLHLTDDQGWRVDLPSRPELVARSSQGGVGGSGGGYLSAEDYAQLQVLCASRGIVVVPEIDVPGHVNAALHAVPGLNADGRAPAPYEGVDVGFSRLDPTLPETEPFLRDVLGDLARMTAGPWVHVGGDEAPTMPAGQYADLVTLACDVVREHGKTPIGWQEIATAPVEPGTVVQVWDVRDGLDAVRDAAERGALVVLSPAPHTYLDHRYDPSTPGQDWAGSIALSDAYGWDPDDVVAGLPPEAVLGVGAALWTETVESIEEVGRQLLPRLAAVAEVAWTARTERDWDDFTRRVADHPRLWNGAGVAWYPSPEITW